MNKWDKQFEPNLRIREAYKFWTPEIDAALLRLLSTKTPIIRMAIALGRKTGAIRARIKKLEIKAESERARELGENRDWRTHPEPRFFRSRNKWYH